jgi:hypothetical protein
MKNRKTGHLTLVFFLASFGLSLFLSLFSGINMVSAAGECGKVDLVFVTDISGSMVDEFKYLQQNVNIVRNYFDNSCFDTQVSYYHLSERDYTGKFGQGRPIASRFWDWTQDANSTFCTECWIDGRDRAGDIHRPKAASEAWGVGVKQLMLNNNWRTDSSKIIVFFGDNFPAGGNRANFQNADAVLAQEINNIAREQGFTLFGLIKNWESTSRNKYGDPQVSDSLELVQLAISGTGGEVVRYKQFVEIYPNDILQRVTNVRLSCGFNAVGQCKLGTKTCSLNTCTLSECVGAVYPSEEICDWVDNDCDGQTDEGCYGVCSNDDGCGISHYKNYFCLGNARYGNYVSWAGSCWNPGTSLSFCNPVYPLEFPQFVEECANGCNQVTGNCIGNGNITCNSNLECNDNNTLTIDRCVNPGREDSYCENIPEVPPACVKDSDCPANNVCRNKVCVGERGNKGCKLDKNCPANEKCINSVCVDRENNKKGFFGTAYGDNLLRDPKFVFCGNGVCDGGESTATCHEDCAVKILSQEEIILNSQAKETLWNKIKDFFNYIFSTSLVLYAN